MKYFEIKQTAQKFRKNPTKAEERLWLYLKNKQIEGYQFYRQHPIIYDSNGNEHFFYIPDFYCSTKKLAIELDGKIHEFQKANDTLRDRRLNEMGINVVRFKNEELNDIKLVLSTIKRYLQ